MKVSICILTYNRFDLLLRTLDSLSGIPLTLVDNGSTDGTAEFVRRWGGICNTDGNRTAGHGMNIAIGAALKHDPDIVLFSADDYEYKPGWYDKFVSFWTYAPDEIALASCHLEDCWSWNEIDGMGHSDGVPFVTRASVPGSNWSFRAKDAGLILPIAETTGGEDLAVCRRLRENGHKMAALDLVTHIGEQQSAWGNESWRYAKPIDRSIYGF